MIHTRLCPLALLGVALLAAVPAAAQTADADESSISASYASPGEAVELDDGRVLNLRCLGQRGPVVLLEAGGNSDSTSWFRVQPLLARSTRVCSYDRAGYGFSDLGPLPRNLSADVADLHALIEAAGFALPVVLVGHSKGSNIVRKYAQLHPKRVAGLVLVDPPEQGADDGMPEDWSSQIAMMVQQREVLLGACAKAAEAGDADTLRGCLRAPPPWMGEAVAAAVSRNKSKPSYWRTLQSELANNAELLSTPVPVDESYGAIPLVLLRAESDDKDVPELVHAITEAKRRQTHERILAGSTHSILIDVPGASHDIQLDRPDAVVSAVARMLDAVTAEPDATP